MRSVSFAVTLALIVVGSVMAGQQARPTPQPASPSSGAQAQALTADQREVLLILRQLALAQATKDVATFRRFTADDFLHFDPNGSLTTKQDWLRILEDEPSRLTSPPDPLDAPLRLMPGTVIRVVGTTAVVVTAPPAAVKNQSGRVVTVLIKQEGTWRQLLVNRQVLDHASGGE